MRPRAAEARAASAPTPSPAGRDDRRLVLEQQVLAAPFLREHGALVELLADRQLADVARLLRSDRHVVWEAAVEVGKREKVTPATVEAELRRVGGDVLAVRGARAIEAALNVARLSSERVHEPGIARKLARALADHVADVPPRVEPERLSLDDIRNPPRERFVLGVMFPLSKPSVFFGPQGQGKTALLAQLFFALAAGAETLWGLPLYPGGGPVLVYTAEDTLDDWKRKAGAVLHAGGVDLERALERFYVVDQTEGVARLSEVVTLRSGSPAESLSRRVAQPTEEQDRLISAARDVGAIAVLVETASRFVEDEDNANFSALQSSLGRVARATGAAVVVTHHATKAASKDNDSAIESARGGGALIANARNAVSLFRADPDEARPYVDRFAAEDLFVLGHGKSTSSTRRQAPLVLARCDAVHGAVFRLPDDVAHTPEQEKANAERLEQARQAELEQLRRLFDVVERALPLHPELSPNWLRQNCHRELGVPKNGGRGVEALVHRAIEAGVLRVNRRTERGITVCLGADPRKPISEQRANPGGSPSTTA